MSGFRPPSPRTQVWRHISLYQLLSLLEQKSVWFSGLSKLEDKFEGSYTLRDSRRLEQLSAFSRLTPGAPARIKRDSVARLLKEIRERVYVSCWYVGTDESAALWRRTVRGGESVAIQTSYRDLELAFGRQLFAGSVRYIDYQSRRIPDGSVLNPFFCKRPIFKHENELRLLLYLPNEVTTANGHYVRATPRRLIRRVMLAPYTASWVKETLDAVLHKYGLKPAIVPSSVDAEPSW